MLHINGVSFIDFSKVFSLGTKRLFMLGTRTFCSATYICNLMQCRICFKDIDKIRTFSHFSPRKHFS